MRLRGVGLYYSFLGNEPLARLANDLRKQGIAKTRQVLSLREYHSVKADDIARLKTTGIVETHQVPRPRILGPTWGKR